jgi:hypothetical protein
MQLTKTLLVALVSVAAVYAQDTSVDTASITSQVASAASEASSIINSVESVVESVRVSPSQPLSLPDHFLQCPILTHLSPPSPPIKAPSPHQSLQLWQVMAPVQSPPPCPLVLPTLRQSPPRSVQLRALPRLLPAVLLAPLPLMPPVLVPLLLLPRVSLVLGCWVWLLCCKLVKCHTGS